MAQKQKSGPMQIRIANLWPENTVLAMNRPDGRAPEALRPLTLIADIAPHANGSVLIGFGNTRVICSAMVENNVPRWMKEQGVTGGWITAEYSMLPYSTLDRKARDITRGKIDGRSTEIQRLIGRALRAVVDLEKLGQRTLWVDCDVLQADGGTRTAAITGGCIAVGLACARLVASRVIPASPIRQLVAAISVGVVNGKPCLDLNYEEDKEATVDLNLVATESNQFVEIQGSGEEATFSREELDTMLELGKTGIAELIAAQRRFLEEQKK
jgi:ribonuclease PH